MVTVNLFLSLVCRNQTMYTRTVDLSGVKPLNVTSRDVLRALCFRIVRQRIQKLSKRLIWLFLTHQIKQGGQLVPEIM